MVRLRPGSLAPLLACLCASLPASALADSHAGHLPTHHRPQRRSTRHHRPRAHRAWRCRNTTLVPDAADLTRVRAAVFCLVNRERVRRGERPLRANARLLHAAEAHTLNMLREDYFNHTGPGGDTVVRRVRAAGYLGAALGWEVGENIAWGTGAYATPARVVAAWMASPGHRANILDARFRDSAVAVSPDLPSALGVGAVGGMYTQDFGAVVR